MLMRLVLCCLLPGAAPARAGECGKFEVAFYEHGPLYFRGEDGMRRGIDKDVIDELGRRSGCRFDPVLESRIRIWTRLENGSLDMTVSGIATPEREKFAHFIPYAVTRNYLLLHKSVPPQASSMDGLLADPRETADFASLVQLLKIGRVQAILALPTTWAPAFKGEKMGQDIRVMDWAPNDGVTGGLILSRQRVPEATAALLRKAIEDMHKDGTLEAIYRRYVDASLAAAMVRF
jgi:polar amino acid transport system substrate-binding protein